MMRPPWLTARRVAGIVFVQLLVFGLVGGGLFLHYGGLDTAAADSGGYVELLNYGNQSETVTVFMTDTQTENRFFELTVTLGTNGEAIHYSVDWPPMTAGEKRLTVVVDENRSNSYEFDVGEDGDGPNVSTTISEDEIDFSLESTGL